VKLASSGVPEWRRLNPRAIEAFRRLDAWWKFVVAGEDDLAEVLDLIARFALPRDRILLQPEAARREDLAARSPWVVQACKRHGFRFSPRIHIVLWGPRRGV
jgi:organic radical activating enzyme